MRRSCGDLLRHTGLVFIRELRDEYLYGQAFAGFPPVKSVGDTQRYEYVVSLRAVQTVDFMTVRFAHLPFEFLELVSRRIINEVTGISRVPMISPASHRPPSNG